MTPLVILSLHLGNVVRINIARECSNGMCRGIQIFIISEHTEEHTCPAQVGKTLTQNAVYVHVHAGARLPRAHHANNFAKKEILIV